MAKKDPAFVVADTFDRLLKERGSKKWKRSDWKAADHTIWNIITARCQKDMGGIESVFTDSDVDFDLLTRGLRRIGENDLARAWSNACAALERDGFLSDGKWSGAGNDRHRQTFQVLKDAVGDLMWGLDAKLASLL